jgi:hypothetical protein
MIPATHSHYNNVSKNSFYTKPFIVEKLSEFESEGKMVFPLSFFSLFVSIQSYYDEIVEKSSNRMRDLPFTSKTKIFFIFSRSFNANWSGQGNNF